MPARLAHCLAALPPARVDLLVAALIGVELQVEAWLVAIGSPGEHLAVAALGVLATTGVALRRRAPVAALVLVVVPQPLLGFLPDATTQGLVGYLFVGLLSVYTIGRHVPERGRAAAGCAVAATCVVTGALVDPFGNDASDFVLLGVFALAGPFLIGRALRDRSALHAELMEHLAEIEHDRDAAAGRAVDAERERIAGELHDVVAHALGGMVVQAGAARRLVGRDDARAAGAFAAVETTGRGALDEIRRLLGVLRLEDADLALSPQPSLAHADALARRTTAAGLPVTLQVEGEPAELPPGVDLTAYRVLQEALAGAREPGRAGHADVTLRYGAERVELVVADDGASVPPRPVAGTRERVALLGGDLSIDMRPGGGRVLRAVLPTAAPQAAEPGGGW